MKGDAPHYVFESTHWTRGRSVAGVDEAGRGPLAGPVVGAAVVLEPHTRLLDVTRDSKGLTPRQRERAFEDIMEKAAAVGIGVVGPREIERLNILNASLKAMALAVTRLSRQPQVVLIDGSRSLGDWLGDDYEQQPIVAGDTKSISVAAASIVAKVTRDRMMAVYDRIYPCYGFARHKGYPTREHLEALRAHGPCPLHRRTFKGVATH